MRMFMKGLVAAVLVDPYGILGVDMGFWVLTMKRSKPVWSLAS